MRPDDWSTPDVRGPERLKLPDARDALLATYRDDLAGGATFANILYSAVGAGANEVWVERDYIDADYRDEFAHFYAQTFRPLPDRCHRLHFLHVEEDRERSFYVGFSVIRPITGRPVSRTILRPTPRIARQVACRTRSVASPYGYRFAAEGFPFISQDYQYGVCAHAAIWMIAHYFHLEFRGPRFYISDIVEGARRRPGFERHTPSPGLSLEQISCALDELGMSPIVYRLDALVGDLAAETPATLACRYLNSRFPVIVLGDDPARTGPHAQVLSGYGIDQEDGELFFVSHDDQTGPYQLVLETDAVPSPQPSRLRRILGMRRSESSSSPDARADDADTGLGQNWEYLVVPTPGRIYLPGEAAESEGVLTLEAEIARRGLKELAARSDDLRARTYVVQSAEYKRTLRLRGVPEGVAAWHGAISMSHWVWVVELQDRVVAEAGGEKGECCVVGEIVIDSTSDRLHPNYLSANLPGWVMRWAYLGAETEALPLEEPTALYRTGTALHA